MFDRNPLLRGAWLVAASFGLGLVSPSASADSAVYGGGPFYNGGQAVMDDLRGSGFTTVILFGVHVHANGDLHYNNDPIITDGTYIGDPGWPSRLATLKQAPTSVTRIEASVGGWGTGDFQNIKDLIAAQGTGPDSVLYRNFQTLKQITGADAIDFDDESTYDLASSTQFGNMLWELGYSITLAPYTNMGYWQSLASNLSGKVDGIHLQAYDGGAGNNPSTWSNALGMTVDPGLWSRHGSGCASGDSPATVQSKMANWKNSAGIVGGFIWLYDDIQACWAQGTSADYANAINVAVGANAPPQVSFQASVNGLSVDFSDTSSDSDGSIVSRHWTFGDGGTSTSATPSHAYASADSYTVTLTVTDDDGASASRTDTLVVGAANLALNRPTTGSASCNSSESPDKAVNGSVSGGNGDKFCSLAGSKWLRVDLGVSQSVGQFVVKHAGAGGESTAWNTRGYDIQVSGNGSKWTTVVSVGDNTASVASHPIQPVTARYVRLNIATPTQNGDPAARIYEFEVY
ncbi:galactose-binding domain-containing protein [Marilutibacter maris]|uniref:galactose-binding domain-containing protein n=1 Tax=Marilutibacter maris TaxID=1605891 RepID=UPI000DA977B8|nr:PKD domain-containing protein [Lysobacter maris]